MSTMTLSAADSDICQQFSNSFSSANTTDNLSINSNALQIHMSDLNTFVNTPSPSSVASSGSTRGRSPERCAKNLCSTLKGDLSAKRRTRYDRLFHQSRVIGRQYMLSMTNLLFQMQRQLVQLKRRTCRMERLLRKQNQTSKPIIRIPRLTEDQISTICIDDSVNMENETNATITTTTTSDQNVTSVQRLTSTHTDKPANIQRIYKHQRHQKRLVNTSKKSSSRIWVNNRQKPIDFQKYCRLCSREYSKRSNYLLQMRTVHKDLRVQKIGKEDRSTDEIVFPDDNDDETNVLTPGDDSTRQTAGSTSSSVILSAQCRKRGRIGGKIVVRSPPRRQTKCQQCGKSFDINYIKTHKRLAHGEISDDDESTQNNPTVGQDEVINLPSIGTPTPVDIVESEVYDEPIRFNNDAQRPIHLAVTCLEGHQVELVNRFFQRFASRVLQSPAIDESTTHLVANDEEHPLRSPLSMKLIEAVAHHCFCLSVRWIDECLKADRIVDEAPFEIRGDNTESEAHDGPRRSRLSATRHALFSNICFMIKCTENPEIKMTNARLEELVTTCGGQIITCVTQRLLEQYTIVVLCDHQYVTERRHNYEQCRKLGINFVSSDWVLESVLEYRQKPFVLFEEIPS